ncbi:PQQ-binding-like beta-propeller repeat protein [Streptomyces sp. TRM72054]|uniref:PQQ-binding-like beta-propeller repeat protein n=1 Tax=Streptomyces sp. TRM72054 TaxID=2870562 RepID=UPI0027E1A397|nr:PQQ-binding-like beta-propeller repeat protein [Streptomyces sp. TRM72054]
MVVLPAEVMLTDPLSPDRKPAVPAPPPRTPRRLLTAISALLLTAALLAAAHQARPAPYGDRLTVHARVQHLTPHLRIQRAAVEAYDRATGGVRWRYTREGRRPLTVLYARGEAITLWDDGLVTDTDTDGTSVRWHRALPAVADWLPAHGGTGVLRPLSRGILAVVTPRRIAAYRTSDGDLRWVLPARKGCVFRPEHALHRGRALLVAQPCRRAAWTTQLVPIDDLGRITPHRTPLGNEIPVR